MKLKQKEVQDKIPKKIEEGLIKLAEKQKWRKAKTWEEYIVFFENRDVYNKFYKNIKLYGKNELFKQTNSMYRYLYLGNRRYWIVWPILNRIETKYIKYEGGVSTQVGGFEKKNLTKD